MFSLWIQRADFESRTWAVTSASDAVAELQSHDWDAERRYEAELAARGADSCAPGLGVADDRDNVLHVCPLDPEVALVHYHHRAWRYVLGLLPVAERTVSTLENVALSEVPSLLGRFCHGQHEWLARRFRGGTSG